MRELTTVEAAKVVGCSSATILSRSKSGHIYGRKAPYGGNALGFRFLVEESEVLRFREVWLQNSLKRSLKSVKENPSKPATLWWSRDDAVKALAVSPRQLTRMVARGEVISQKRGRFSVYRKNPEYVADALTYLNASLDPVSVVFTPQGEPLSMTIDEAERRGVEWVCAGEVRFVPKVRRKQKLIYIVETLDDSGNIVSTREA